MTNTLRLAMYSVYSGRLPDFEDYTFADGRAVRMTEDTLSREVEET